MSLRGAGRMAAKAFAALVLTLATTAVQYEHGEYALYGNMSLDQYEPREVAGWPAPFLADRVGVSVSHDVHLLDDPIRGGALLASWSFWFLVVLAIGKARAYSRNRGNSRA